ncbi:MAG: HAD family hydrolase [Pseudomonadota bacterium]
MIKAVVFDCDGVMFDSKEANRAFYDHILREFGRGGMTEDQLSYVHMHTVDESIAYLFQGNGDLFYEANEFRTSLDYCPFLHMMNMEPGLEEFLSFLKPRYKTAISTNRTNTMGKLLEVFGLSQYFDMVVSALDVENPKPHPESLRKIMRELGCGPYEMVYIGDSEIDKKAAEAAGVPLVAYKNRCLQAQYHVDSFHEVISVLEDGNNMRNAEWKRMTR